VTCSSRWKRIRSSTGEHLQSFAQA
jgi:hypothetical protein